MTSQRSLIAICLVALGACSDDSASVPDASPSSADAAPPILAAGFESELAQHGGCADVQAFAKNTADNTVLIVRDFERGLVDMATQSQDTVSVTVDLAQDASADLRVDYGVAISQPVCNDVLGPDTMLIESWQGISGSVTFEVSPEPQNPPYGKATVTLDSVVIELNGAPGVTLTIPSLVIADVSVGWLPG